MAKFRLLLISLAAWQILLFNLERPDILSGGRNIDLASFVYVLAAMVMVGMLMMPDLGKERIELVVVPTMVLYVILKIYVSIRRELMVDTMFVYISITEVAVLLITVWIARNVSVAVASFEDAVETTVLGTDKLRVLPMAEGEEQINHELFRARRFDRPVSILYLRNTLLDGMRSSFGQQFDLEAAFRRRYLQARIAQLAEAMTYRSDIIAWHNDNLVICLPETTKEHATQFAQQLHEMLKMRLNLSIKMGLATFPYDALIYSDLIDAALLHPVVFLTDLATPAEQEHPDDHPPKDPPSSDRRETSDQPTSETRVPDPLATQELNPVARPLGIIRSLLSGPQLFPLDGMPLFSSVATTSSTDPNLWVNRLPYQSAASRQLYRVIKRAFDLSVTIVSMPFVAVLMVLIMIAIKLDGPGPIFFRQYRTGIGGRRFVMYKFRTMVPDAEEKLKELAAQGLARLDENGKLAEPLKLKRDPRVTRVGRILRKTSLDEIPQLFNVLRGDMSLVGPRPTSWNVDSYTLMQTERLSVRPGITGLWQVSSRGSSDFDNWLEWDMKYIEKMSLSLDLQILVRTVFKVFQGSGAR